FLPPAPATTDISPLSLHDALPILGALQHRRLRFARFAPRRPEVQQHDFAVVGAERGAGRAGQGLEGARGLGRQNAFATRSRLVQDRKSTRLNSSHLVISYAVFCLK